MCSIVEVAVTALQMDLPAQGAAGQHRARVQDRVDRGAAHAECAEQPFEHHRGVHSFMCMCGSSAAGRWALKRAEPTGRRGWLLGGVSSTLSRSVEATTALPGKPRMDDAADTLLRWPHPG